MANLCPDLLFPKQIAGLSEQTRREASVRICPRAEQILTYAKYSHYIPYFT